jgi:hypothetical protein
MGDLDGRLRDLTAAVGIFLVAVVVIFLVAVVVIFLVAVVVIFLVAVVVITGVLMVLRETGALGPAALHWFSLAALT